MNFEGRSARIDAQNGEPTWKKKGWKKRKKTRKSGKKMTGKLKSGIRLQPLFSILAG
ncbi:MAG: hypothetical protein ACE5IB_01470 [Candidatus Geothermarchaeales archaeon]